VIEVEIGRTAGPVSLLSFSSHVLAIFLMFRVSVPTFSRSSSSKYFLQSLSQLLKSSPRAGAFNSTQSLRSDASPSSSTFISDDAFPVTILQSGASPPSFATSTISDDTFSVTMASPNGVSAPHPDHTLLIFDLDNCLYPHSCGIGPTMSKNLLKFCLDLGMTEEETRRRCWNWYRAYGMSLHGLMDEHEVDVEEFDRRVDLAVPVPDLLPKELPAVLSDVLDRLKDYRKTIFTSD